MRRTRSWRASASPRPLRAWRKASRRLTASGRAASKTALSSKREWIALEGQEHQTDIGRSPINDCCVDTVADLQQRVVRSRRLKNPDNPTGVVGDDDQIFTDIPIHQRIDARYLVGRVEDEDIIDVICSEMNFIRSRRIEVQSRRDLLR
jgi:hypothetical protein